MKKLFTPFTLGILVATLVAAAASPAIAQIFEVDRVEAHSTDTWRVWASSGSSRVVVDGDGDTDLDCYVYDRSGRLLGMDEDYTDYCIVNVFQPTSGDIRIEVRNLGSISNVYSLRVR